MAVQDWFGKHRDCAVAVDGMCKPVRASATASWTDSTEGRVCMAARNVAQWVRKPNQTTTRNSRRVGNRSDLDLARTLFSSVDLSGSVSCGPKE